MSAKVAIIRIYLIRLLGNNIFVLLYPCIIVPFLNNTAITCKKTRLDAQAECEFLIATTIGKIPTHIPSLVRIISYILHSSVSFMKFSK